MNEWAQTELLVPEPSRRDLIRPVLLQQQASRSSLREILNIAFMDRRRIALAFLIPMLITVVISFLPAPRYTSEASLLLRLGREYMYRPEVGDATGAAPIAYDAKETLRAEIEILNSRDIKEAALAQLGAATVYPWMAEGAKDAADLHAAALIDLQSRFDAKLIKDSNVASLSYTHRDPQMAARVLGRLIDVYLDRRQQIFSPASLGTAEFQVRDLRSRLDDGERRLEAFKQAHRIQSFGEQQSLLIAQRNAIDSKLGDIEWQLAQAKGRAGSLQGSLGGLAQDVTLSSETLRSEALDSARKSLLDLQLKERDLSARFKDSVPLVQDVRADIAKAEAFIAELERNPNRSVRTGRSPVRDMIESDWLRTLADQRQADASRATLKAQREAIDERLATLAANQRELLGLERDRKLAEGAYEAAVRRLEEERVVQTMERERRSSVSVVQDARVPLEAKSLQPIILAVGFVLSLVAALLTAFLSALWRDTFVTPEQVPRELGLPLLVAVPLTR